MSERKGKIYIFDNSPNGDQWHHAVALAEDGHGLGSHICSHPAYIPYDMGITSERKREEYRAHYPDGYELILTTATSPEVQAAYKLNQELFAAKEKA